MALCLKCNQESKNPHCNHCGNHHPAWKDARCFMMFYYIWEKDLLELAKRDEGWRARANRLGFTDKKIDTPWPHKDEGRRIEYEAIPVRVPEHVAARHWLWVWLEKVLTFVKGLP